MKCVLCAKTSIEVKINPFPLGPEAREMLQENFSINAEAALANYGICDECSSLPFVERNKLAEKAIRRLRDELRPGLTKNDLRKRRN
jgi:hypothetical protein